MGNVISFGRPRPRFLARHAGFLVLAACLGVIAAVNIWRDERVAAPPSAPALIAVRAVDGDTLSAQENGRPQRIRLSGIDAPELSQTCRNAHGRSWSCGSAARSRLAALVSGGGVACVKRGEDRYGRALATCSATGVADVGETMVREGYALNYSRYTSDYASAEREARTARRGLWQGDFDNPEDWRRRHTRIE